MKADFELKSQGDLQVVHKTADRRTDEKHILFIVVFHQHLSDRLRLNKYYFFKIYVFFVTNLVLNFHTNSH